MAACWHDFPLQCEDDRDLPSDHQNMQGFRRRRPICTPTTLTKAPNEIKLLFGGTVSGQTHTPRFGQIRSGMISPDRNLTICSPFPNSIFPIAGFCSAGARQDPDAMTWTFDIDPTTKFSSGTNLHYISFKIGKIICRKY